MNYFAKMTYTEATDWHPRKRIMTLSNGASSVVLQTELENELMLHVLNTLEACNLQAALSLLLSRIAHIMADEDCAALGFRQHDMTGLVIGTFMWGNNVLAITVPRSMYNANHESFDNLLTMFGPGTTHSQLMDKLEDAFIVAQVTAEAIESV